ncbi:hypothetical protein PFMALIP_04418 [Plasmodium falciparum MaliPS096_E11]|uniref:Uncharacterized protein n=1 Tax=Plasmodium falciparum MaliPS096_E11 TaxID=1036727 RepID=A0A024WLZ9_PLAFA|nr:hypothetical protein PFMALIP_04418 [Plasmodium falciparum MaliPS096_E11]
MERLNIKLAHKRYARIKYIKYLNFLINNVPSNYTQMKEHICGETNYYEHIKYCCLNIISIKKKLFLIYII